MEDRLKAILIMVNDWLKFAEVKNGALLTLASGLVLALVKNYPQFAPSSKVESCYLTAIALMSITAIVCLLSFIPVLKIPWFESEGKPGTNDNLFFFADIARYSASEYVTALLIANGEQSRTITKLEVHLALQAIANARIAHKKYRCFRGAVWSLLIGVLFLGITGISLLY